jgi:uncharacterized protein (DUF2141 family)
MKSTRAIMASTFASGITCAALIAGLATLASLSNLAAAETGGAPGYSLDVTITGLRNAKGNIRLAICPAGAGFPDCGQKAVRTATLAIENGTARASFADLPAGTYAIGTFHDANRNGKLDTFLGIPNEGFGFSRNPPIRPRAPRFDETKIDVSGNATASILMRYLL